MKSLKSSALCFKEASQTDVSPASASVTVQCYCLIKHSPAPPGGRPHHVISAAVFNQSQWSVKSTSWWNFLPQSLRPEQSVASGNSRSRSVPDLWPGLGTLYLLFQSEGVTLPKMRARVLLHGADGVKHISVLDRKLWSWFWCSCKGHVAQARFILIER